jgi:hypothetical protein
MLMLFYTGAYSFVCFNGAGGGYGGGGKTAARNGSIEMYVMKGGASFLAANSDYQTFLAMVELQDLQGLDFAALNTRLNSAVTNMTNAVDTYAALVRDAEALPYDEEFNARLKTFDYETFMLEKGLNGTVFGGVAAFLETGDITGLLKNTYNGFINIAKMLETIKFDISRDRLPELSLIRRVNEAFGELSLWGSYAAGVFSAVQE